METVNLMNCQPITVVLWSKILMMTMMDTPTQQKLDVPPILWTKHQLQVTWMATESVMLLMMIWMETAYLTQMKKKTELTHLVQTAMEMESVMVQ